MNHNFLFSQGDSDRGDSDACSDDGDKIQLESLFGRSKRNSGRKKSVSEADDFDKLSKILKRAESLGKDENVSVTESHDEFSLSTDGQNSVEKAEDHDRRSSLTRRRSSQCTASASSVTPSGCHSPKADRC